MLENRLEDMRKQLQIDQAPLAVHALRPQPNELLLQRLRHVEDGVDLTRVKPYVKLAAALCKSARRQP